MSEGPRDAVRGLWPFVAAAALILGFGVAVAHFDLFSRFRHYVGSEAVPQTLARLGRSGKTLRLLDYKTSVGTRLEGYDDEILPQDMPSSTILGPDVVQSGVPILSLVVESRDLVDRDHGILVNYEKRGRSWERPGYVTLFENGGIRFATGAGVRVHGGRSRAMQHKSFQLRFRKLYGAGSAPLGLIDGESDAKINSLVIHNSLTGNETHTFHYVNPIAYEVAERIGCIVPAWTPVRFYLNGEYQGPYVLTERINKDFFAAHYGHDDFVIFDTRSSDLKRGSRKDIRELLSWSKPANVPEDMAEMAGKVDLASLTNWYLSIIYGGTTDPFQGYAARDKTREDSRWFWINWDMDHSFVDFYAQAAHPWEVDTFGGRGHILGNRDARAVIFRKLITKSPEYRKYFLSRLAETLNHDLSPEYMDGLIDRYRQTADDLGFERRYLLDTLAEFAEHRPAVLRRQAAQYLYAGPSYSLTVHGPAAVPLKVDGRSVGESYRGWYFGVTPARVELDGTASAQGFTWVVNGKPLGPTERALTLELKSDTTVEVAPRS
jgi:hypothetical protein